MRRLVFLWLAVNSLAGCSISPKRAEFALEPRADCAKGCLIFTGRRILFRHSF